MKLFFIVFIWFVFFFLHFLSFHSSLRLKLPVWAECSACMCARDPESIFCMCKQMFCASPALSLEVRASACFLSSPMPLLSFHKHLFLRRHVGDTCVPAAALRNQVTSPKWSPLHRDNAEGDPPAPNSARLAAKTRGRRAGQLTVEAETEGARRQCVA